MKQYKIYEGFPTYKEVLTTYNELMEKVKNITTIEQAKQYQNKYGITVEINGILISEYIMNGGTDAEIEWIRYEEVYELSYVYCRINNGEVNDISFDVYCEWSTCEFIDSAYALTQEQYYQAIENHFRLYNNSEYKVVGYDTEELPDIKFVA
ncbi:MAG: hypothetical protein PHT02_01165 [Tissierellia bacterium]|nr:hypothetical protein [Tissierellia bacterium]